MNTTIFKNIQVFDNILENPYEVIDRARSFGYYTNESNPLMGFNLCNLGDKPQGIWRGYRTEGIQKLDSSLFDNLNNEIFCKILGTPYFKYVVSSYMHFGDKSIDNCDELWHKDTNSLFAFVLYLNPNPPPNSGTIIEDGDQTVVVENKFNRLVFYSGLLNHRPENYFGSTFFDSRLTLTTFIEKLSVSV